MKDYSVRNKLLMEHLTDLHSAGLAIIVKHNKYNVEDYDDIKIWTVGLGCLSDNYDIRDYDPKKYTYTELRVLALQYKFKDIGGPGIDANDYLVILKKYYPGNLDDVLCLTIVTKYICDELTPTDVSNTHNLSLASLYKQAGIDMSEENIDKQVSHTRLLLASITDAFIRRMYYGVPGHSVCRLHNYSDIVN